jgi:hypothetical protein
MPSKILCPREKKESQHTTSTHLFRARRVLGDGLGAFRHGVLGEFTGEDEADGGLDLSGRDGRLLVVRGELGRLSGDALEDI